MLYTVSYPVRTGTIDPKDMQSALFSLPTVDHDFRTRDSVRKKDDSWAIFDMSPAVVKF